MLNALTVDVEEWFHVCGIERKLPRERWDELESRVELSVRRVLDLLDRHGARATFFVLGWVASRHPELVRAIRAAGHEIASHGMWHCKVFQQTPAEFEADVRASRDLLTQISWITGNRLETEPFLWSAQRSAPDVRASLRVFPVTTMRLLWENLPFTGGMGFRTSPYWYTAWFFEQLNRRGVPGMIYLHPWELDDAQPRLPLGPLVRFMHGFNLGAVARNAGGLLRHFRFGTLSETLDQVVARPRALRDFVPPEQRAAEAVA
jgi:hypothetical protein